MRLNRIWLFSVIFAVACGVSIAPAYAVSKDKNKQSKSTKVVKSPKKPKTVRVTVTRANAPEVAAPPSFQQRLVCVDSMTT